MVTELRYHTEREICASWGPVVIRICDGVRTEVADLERLQALFDELLETHADIALLLVFTHGTPLPDSATQRHARGSMRKYERHLVISVALLGLGFWASAVRTGLSAIIRMIRGGSYSIEGNVEGAITRLTSELVGLDGDQLLDAYEQLWAELNESHEPMRAVGS